MDDMSSEVFAYDAIPATASNFVHLIFQISGENSFLFKLFERDLQAFIEVLQDLVDILLIHVSGFYLWFNLCSHTI
jgi:hypothetical protein